MVVPHYAGDRALIPYHRMVELKQGCRTLDAALSSLTDKGPDAERPYEQMHHVIASIDVGLYRPYPDPTQRETIALA